MQGQRSFLKQISGWQEWRRTAPIAFLEASVCTTRGKIELAEIKSKF